MNPKFKMWPKIPRVSNKKEIYTEKIDGTNACIVIEYIRPHSELTPLNYWYAADGSMYGIWAQSRSRFITPDDDNFGFAKWVQENCKELQKLGPGYHYGEWWGLGIQRGYNQTEKKFSLFNTKRWGPHNPNTPQCCSVVPTIHKNSLEQARQFLIETGSLASPGFMNVEGIVVYECNTDTLWKEIINK